MKGVVLAGGTGSRLYPLTKVTNKHLLPVYDKPMIYYPIQTLMDAGIDKILIVTGGKNAGDFLRLLGSGKDLGAVHLNYTYQEGEGGIADALSLAESFRRWRQHLRHSRRQHYSRQHCAVLSRTSNVRVPEPGSCSKTSRTPSVSASPRSATEGSSASKRSRSTPNRTMRSRVSTCTTRLCSGRFANSSPPGAASSKSPTSTTLTSDEGSHDILPA